MLQSLEASSADGARGAMGAFDRAADDGAAALSSTTISSRPHRESYRNDATSPRRSSLSVTAPARFKLSTS